MGSDSSPHIPDTSVTPSARTYMRSCSVVMGVGCGVFGGNILGGTWRPPVSALGFRDAVRGGALCRSVDGEDAEAEDM